MQDQSEPGAVISPLGSVATAPQASVSHTPTSVAQPLAPSISSTQTVMPPQHSNLSQDTPVEQPQAPVAPAVSAADIPQPSSPHLAQEHDSLLMTWQSQASDSQSKAGSWYIGIVFVAVLLAVATFLLLGRDVLVSVAVLLAVLSFAYLAKLNLREQQYALAEEGIYIGDKLRKYEEFKNFSQVEDASGPTIILIPHKRFASPLVLKLTHDSVDMAVDTLSHFLPVEERKPDAIDHLMRRIRL